MIELPEAKVVAKQMAKELSGKSISSVIVAQSPHKFAWYSGDPMQYSRMLLGKRITGSESFGGQVELWAEDIALVFSDGVNLIYHTSKDTLPKKHQLLLEFSDYTYLCVTISMYGGMLCTPIGENDNQYYLIAKEKPSPLSGSFDLPYFLKMFSSQDDKLSLKAFLATNQRIPGVGNGVLQDILFNAGFHPKKKVASLAEEDRTKLFKSTKDTLKAMTDQGGRDTEKDFYGNPGRYLTILSKNTVGSSCKRCKSTIVKEAYMGGSIYYCPVCQVL